MILQFNAGCATRCLKTQKHEKDYEMPQDPKPWKGLWRAQLRYAHGNLLVLLELVHAQEMSISAKNWTWAPCCADDTHSPPPPLPSHSWGENGTNAPSFAMVGKWVGVELKAASTLLLAPLPADPTKIAVLKSTHLNVGGRLPELSCVHC